MTEEHVGKTDLARSSTQAEQRREEREGRERGEGRGESRGRAEGEQSCIAKRRQVMEII